MKDEINCLASDRKNASVKCLMESRVPLYGWRDERNDTVVTIEWMQPDIKPLREFGKWKIISSLRYLNELGICRIWSNRYSVIHYTTHFRKKMTVYPIWIKNNGEAFVQIDCIVVKAAKYRTSKPFKRAIYLGLRCDPLKISNYRLTKDIMPHIVDFLSCLGNRDPIVMVTHGDLLPKATYDRKRSYLAEPIPFPNNTMFRLVAFTLRKF